VRSGKCTITPPVGMLLPVNGSLRPEKWMVRPSSCNAFINI